MAQSESKDTSSKIVEQLNQNIDWHWLSEIAQEVINQGIDIQQIPAPTFHESKRADYVARQFEAAGLQSISVDDVFNVYGFLPGQNAGPELMIAAHTDTVFPFDTDLTIHRQQHRISGPGLGDNSIGVAAMLGLIAALKRINTVPSCGLWIVATTREEGLGDLGGMKAAFSRLQDRIAAVINIEGLAFGHIYHAGIAVRRLHITAQADGGHSWLHFGRQSAIHGLINLGSRITSIRPPDEPRTTYNIGLINGGHSINSIATQAEMWLDMRSEARESLQLLEAEVQDHINVINSDQIRLKVEVVGDRPAGYIAPEHDLVKMALAALEQVGLHGELETGSTDGNIPLAANCPTVTIGLTRGGNAHRLDEYVETDMVSRGLQQIVLLTLATAQWVT